MQPHTMRAVVVPHFGPPQVLELRDVPIPEPQQGQVLIQVAYAGVNYAELMARRGEFHALPTPFTPGYEVSGTIAALGPGVEGLHVGQPVSALTVQGGYAQYATAQAALTFPLDTSSNSIALHFGYDHVFPLEGFTQSIMEATNGKDIDIALDARGEPTRSQNLAVLAPFGRLVVYGNASNAPEQPLSPSSLWQSNKGVIGYSITSLTQTSPHLVARTVQQVLRLIAEGQLKIDVSTVLPLEQAAEAHRRIESRSHTGKLLLRVQE